MQDGYISLCMLVCVRGKAKEILNSKNIGLLPRRKL